MGLVFRIPIKVSQPQVQLDKIIMLLYGPPKIGKSTAAASFPGAVFIPTEPGLKYLPVFKMTAFKEDGTQMEMIESWDDFLEVCAILLNDPNDFKTVCIDTIDILMKLCEEYIVRENKLEHISDPGWAKGYRLMYDEFRRVMLKLLTKFGVILISHREETEIKARGKTYTKISSTLSKGAKKICNSLADIIAYMTTEITVDAATGKTIDQRVLITKADETIDSGARGSVQASFPDKIYLPDPSVSGAYDAIVAAVAEHQQKLKSSLERMNVHGGK